MAEFVRDPNGGWRLQGELPANAVPAPMPAAASPKPVQAKPTQPKPRGFWGQIANDLSFEAKALFMGGQAGLKRAGKNLATSPGRLWLLQHSAIAEAQRNAIEAVQRLQGKPGDYATTRLGFGIDRYEDMIYRRFGLTPPSQQQGTEALLTGFGTEAVAQLGMAAVGGAVLGAAAKARGIGALARPVQGLLNPAAGKTAVGKVSRFGLAAVADEAATAPLVNNTGGSAVSLVNMVLGTNFEDPVTPEMDRIESMRAGFVPNTAFSLLAGGSLIAGTGAIARFRRQNTTTTRQQRARTRLDQQGVTAADPESGARGFTEKKGRPTWKDVEEALGIDEAPEAPDLPPPPEPAVEAPAGVEGEAPPVAGAPAAEPGGALVPTRPVDPMAMDPVLPWEVPYDPQLPEADTLLRLIDDALEPEQIEALAQGKGPVLEELEELVVSRQPADVNPDRSFENSAAPRTALSQQYLDGYQDQLEAMTFEELRDLAINSPEVSLRTSEVTGKPPEEFTKSDIIDGLLAIPDQAVLANRVAGRQLSPMLRVDEIEVDPKRFQFKGNTDQAGIQAGNSLEGVERWNPDAEGLIQVWTDPANGRTYVVNGHNRLAKAKSLGVPTMRVTYLNARTAEQARAMGAMANIAEGGGTAFDAAKFLRQSGITSTRQLKELGANLSDQRNLWVPGLALSRLPEDTFLMAVNGTLDLDDAVMIGKSGLGPETMGEVAKVAIRRGWTGQKLGEMLAQGDATRATAKGGKTLDLFGNAEETSLRELKADLSIRVRALLRADRNAFRSASRNADNLRKGNNVIDEAASGEIANEAAKALKTFDQLKYETSRISDLLNEGVQELAAGAQLEPIAARIAREAPAALELELGGKKGVSSTDAPAKAPERPADPESPETLEQEIKASSEQLQKWEALPQVRRDKLAADARKALLTERKRANRLEKQARFDAMNEAVLEGIGKPEGPDEGVTVPDRAAERKLAKELEMDAWAQQYLEWYDAQPRLTLQGKALEKAKAVVVARAIESEEVRPPATPIPEPLPVGDVNLQGMADELLRDEIGPNTENVVGTELLLREAYGLQDTQLQKAQLEAERMADGYYDKTTEEVLPEAVEVFLGDEPVPARPQPAVRADQFQADPEVLAEQAIAAKTISAYQPTRQELEVLQKVLGEEQITRLRTGNLQVRGAEAVWELIPDEPGAPRRVRKKLQERIEKATSQVLDEVMAQLPEIPPAPTGPSIADTFAAAAQAMAQSDARLYRGLGEFIQNMDRQLSELADVEAPPAVDVEAVPVLADKVRAALPPGKAGQPAKKALAKARRKAEKAQTPEEAQAASAELRDTAAQVAEELVADTNAELNTIRQRAAEEGC